MPVTIEELLLVLRERGAVRYGGEAVTQLQHALQCAHLARREGAPPELVAAALLHDVGHLLHSTPGHAMDEDDFHQFRALPFLRGLMPDAVLEPIRLHVDAKRYLCQASPGYREALSTASRTSLELQGGVFSRTEAKAFLGRPWAADAVRLRQWDDRAKDPRMRTPPLEHFAALLREVGLRGSPGDAD